jgi:hypothetical protein
MPTRRATWLIRSKRSAGSFFDALDKFFLLDTRASFL